jgi:hypothetical protein
MSIASLSGCSGALLAGRNRYDEVPGLSHGTAYAPLVVDEEATDGGGDLKGELASLGER